MRNITTVHTSKSVRKDLYLFCSKFLICCLSMLFFSSCAQSRPEYATKWMPLDGLYWGMPKDEALAELDRQGISYERTYPNGEPSKYTIGMESILDIPVEEVVIILGPTGLQSFTGSFHAAPDEVEGQRALLEEQLGPRVALTEQQIRFRWTDHWQTGDSYAYLDEQAAERLFRFLSQVPLSGTAERTMKRPLVQVLYQAPDEDGYGVLRVNGYAAGELLILLDYMDAPPEGLSSPD